MLLGRNARSVSSLPKRFKPSKGHKVADRLVKVGEAPISAGPIQPRNRRMGHESKARQHPYYQGHHLCEACYRVRPSIIIRAFS